MILRRNLQLVCLALFMNLSVSESCAAQNSSIEFWPETDIWYRLNPSWRLSSLIAITKYNESKNRDLSINIQADYAWGHTKHPIYRRLVDGEREQSMKAWLARSGYMKGWSLGENSGNYSEDMFFAEIHRRIPLKGEILLSHRFRTDLRWLGDNSDFSYRFRYRLMLEKEYKSGKYSIVPFINVEPYWDSRYVTFNRVRAIAGATVVRESRLALESNITYQYDSHYDTENLYALNVILHLFLEKNQAKPKASNSP